MTSRAFTRAFTLVEILVVVVILGIVGVMTAVYIGGRDDLKAAAAARQFVSGVHYAQNLAIARRRPHFVVPLDGWLLVCTHDGTSWKPIDHPAGVGPVGVDLRGTSGVTRRDKFFGGGPVLGFDEAGGPFLSDQVGSLRQPLTSRVNAEFESGKYVLKVWVEPVTGEVTIE